jgi:hypothetical protein
MCRSRHLPRAWRVVASVVGGLSDHGAMLPQWDASTWFGAIASAVAVASLGLAYLAWQHPRSPKPPAPKPHELVRVEVANMFPVFDEPDGSQTLGDHLIGVTLRNGSERQVRAVGWGVQLPGDRKLVARVRAAAWEPTLPHWVQASDHATWHLEADEMRTQARAHDLDFTKMVAYVSLADGRTISADGGLPLKESDDS